MDQNCQKCRTPNPPGACFCKHCGMRLGATAVQGRTVVSPQTAAPTMSPQQLNTIVQRVQKTFGTGTLSLRPNQTLGPSSDQREHIVFVIDRSGSMAEPYDGSANKLEAAVRANITMVIKKDPLDEVAVVSFNSGAAVLLQMSPIQSQKRKIIETLQSLTPDNGTDINAGLATARGVFDWERRDVVRRTVLLTDGHGGDPLGTATDLKSKGVVIDVIGVGDCPDNVDENLLRKVASVIQGQCRYQFIKDHQTLVAHYTRLANKTATF